MLDALVAAALAVAGTESASLEENARGAKALRQRFLGRVGRVGERYFDSRKLAKAYACTHAIRNAAILEQILSEYVHRQMPNCKLQTVLDIGCGPLPPLPVWEHNARARGQKCTYMLTDYAPGALAVAREVASQLFLRGDAHFARWELPKPPPRQVLRERPYQMIYLGHSLGEMLSQSSKDPTSLIANLTRTFDECLTPGGALLVVESAKPTESTILKSFLDSLQAGTMLAGDGRPSETGRARWSGAVHVVKGHSWKVPREVLQIVSTLRVDWARLDYSFLFALRSEA